MKIRTDFVTNSSSSSFILSKESMERGLEKYNYPAAAEMLKKEGKLTVEVLYKLIHEIYSEFWELCCEIVVKLGITTEVICERLEQKGIEANEYNIFCTIEDLIEEAYKSSGKDWLEDDENEWFGVPISMLSSLLEKLHHFDEQWRDCETYQQFLEKAAENESLQELEMELVDHRNYSEVIHWSIQQATKLLFRKGQHHCRFGRTDISDCKECPDCSYMCLGEVGLYSWDENFPYEITHRLMQFCEYGSNHH